MPPNAGEISFISIDLDSLEKLIPNAESIFPWNESTHDDSTNTQSLNEMKIEAKVSANEKTTGNYWDWDGATEPKADTHSETKDVDDYWQWNNPAEEKKAKDEASESKSDREKLVKKLLEEEEAIKCLLIDDIESRLIEDGKKIACEGKIEESIKENEEIVNYWDWDGATEPKADTHSETKDNDDYWQWNTPDDNVPTTTTLTNKINKDEFIKKILLEEELRQFFMVDNIEKRLIDESNKRREDIVEHECADDNDSADSETYWYWGESSKGEIRLDLKVDSIEERLVAESQKRLSSLPESDLKYNSESMKYWEWEDSKADVIYEFPIDVLREETNKEELLKKILLEEEIRRSLMVGNIEMNLRKEAKRQQEECKEYESSMTDSCNEYWSW